MHAAPCLRGMTHPYSKWTSPEQLTEVSMFLAGLQAMSPVQTDPYFVDPYVLPIKSNQYDLIKSDTMTI